LADEIADADEAVAARALKEAIGRGLIEIGDGARNANSHHAPKVYRVSKAGADLVEQRQREALPGMADNKDSAGAAADHDCPI